MDSHPYHAYSHETFIFILGAPHEEVQGRQAKLHPGFTLGKLVQLPLVSHFFEIPTLFCPNGLNDVLQNFLIGQSFAFFCKFFKNGTCVKKIIRWGHSMPVPLTYSRICCSYHEIKGESCHHFS